MSNTVITVSVRMPRETHGKLKQAARKDDRSLSKFALALIAQGLKKKKRA